MTESQEELRLIARIESLSHDQMEALIIGLDDLVCDAKSEEASAINNAGAISQSNYLLEWMTVQDLREQISNILNEEW